jgi:hypothetical protein
MGEAWGTELTSLDFFPVLDLDSFISPLLLLLDAVKKMFYAFFLHL